MSQPMREYLYRGQHDSRYRRCPDGHWQLLFDENWKDSYFTWDKDVLNGVMVPVMTLPMDDTLHTPDDLEMALELADLCEWTGDRYAPFVIQTKVSRWLRQEVKMALRQMGARR